MSRRSKATTTTKAAPAPAVTVASDDEADSPSPASAEVTTKEKKSAAKTKPAAKEKAAPKEKVVKEKKEKVNLAAERYADTHHYLMKNEPPYSLAKLKDREGQKEPWVGVRNLRAKNQMLYGMKLGYEILYYNASISNPHIAGVAKVCSAPYPDPTAFDKESPYYDAKSVKEKPTWYLVDVKYEREFARPVYLAELRYLAEQGELSKDFGLLNNNRLSIHPLTDEEYNFLCAQSKKPLPSEVKLKPEKEVVDYPSRHPGHTSVKKAEELNADGTKKARGYGWGHKRKSPEEIEAAAKKKDEEAENTPDEDAEYDDDAPSDEEMNEDGEGGEEGDEGEEGEEEEEQKEEKKEEKRPTQGPSKKQKK